MQGSSGGVILRSRLTYRPQMLQNSSKEQGKCTELIRVLEEAWQSCISTDILYSCGWIKGTTLSLFIIQSGGCINKFCMNCSVSRRVLTNNYYDCWLAIVFKNAYQGVLDQLQLFSVYKLRPNEGAVRSKTEQKETLVITTSSTHR